MLPSIYLTASALINEHFGKDLAIEQTISSEEDLLNKLNIIVSYCLEKDFSRLVNTLYRIDVDEKEFRKAMELGDLKLTANKISELILKRELEKAEMRERYRE